MRFIDLTGSIFGRLTVLDRAAENDPQRKPRWVCMCSCGKTTTVRRSDLRKGATSSCGCYMVESRHTGRPKHGCSNKVNSEYTTWQGMKHRCTNPKDVCYRYYGGRGITVCDRWFNSFENFIADMGVRPFKGAQLDRIDNEKGYSPENCKWSTAKENANNKRKPVRKETSLGGAS
jgi:hypothetical protein